MAGVICLFGGRGILGMLRSVFNLVLRQERAREKEREPRIGEARAAQPTPANAVVHATMGQPEKSWLS